MFAIRSKLRCTDRRQPRRHSVLTNVLHRQASPRPRSVHPIHAPRAKRRQRGARVVVEGARIAPSVHAAAIISRCSAPTVHALEGSMQPKSCCLTRAPSCRRPLRRTAPRGVGECGNLPLQLPSSTCAAADDKQRRARYRCSRGAAVAKAELNQWLAEAWLLCRGGDGGGRRGGRSDGRR